MKDDELIYLPQSDDIITVCSQWNSDRIAPMIDIARTLGYSVEEVEYETLDGDGYYIRRYCLANKHFTAHSLRHVLGSGR